MLTRELWPYEKLDAEEAGEVAYDNFWKGMCSYSVASGIITPLQKKIGEPYLSLPTEALRFGYGGIANWGTVCGSLIGAAFVVNLICGGGEGQTGDKIINELMHWYSKSELPVYKPRNSALEIPKTMCNSTLCRASVRVWMKKAGCDEYMDAERRHRCARLSADVAMQTVNFLNQCADGIFKAEHEMSEVPYSNNSFAFK